LDKTFPKGLSDLISVQSNLKVFTVFVYCYENFTEILPSLTNLPKDLIKLELYGGKLSLPLSFIAKFANLRDLVLSFSVHIQDFDLLRHVTFPRLRTLKVNHDHPTHGHLIKFLENNGQEFKRDLSSEHQQLIKLDHSQVLSQIETLCTIFLHGEMETLKVIFDHCQQLESVKVWCCKYYFLNEPDLLQLVASHSPKMFRELKLYYAYEANSEVSPNDLDSFFKSWANRIPRKSFSLIIISSKLKVRKENVEMIGNH
jgi:hypothetical protein